MFLCSQSSGRGFVISLFTSSFYFCFQLVFLHLFSPSSVGQGCEVTNPTSPRHVSRQSSKGGSVIPVGGEPPEHTIDCGDIVWGMAFGSSVPEKQSRCINIEWHHFRFGQDQLLLATGLNNGRIKIWDVYTGESTLGPFASLLHRRSQRWKL